MLIKRQFLCIYEVGKDEKKMPFFGKVQAAGTTMCGYKKRNSEKCSKIHEQSCLPHREN